MSNNANPPIEKSQLQASEEFITAAASSLESSDVITDHSTQTIISEPSPITITPYQLSVYVSFVLTFCFAGFIALALLHKINRSSVRRHSMGTVKLLICVFLWMAVNRFYASNLYVDYLTRESASLPTAWLLLFWVFSGPIVVWALIKLLDISRKGNANSLLTNAITSFIIFATALIAVSGEFQPETNRTLALLACVLCVIPTNRSLTKFKMAQVAKVEYLRVRAKLLLYSLIFIPCMFPLLVLLKVVSISGETYLFVSNLLCLALTLIIAFTVLTGDFDEL